MADGAVLGAIEQELLTPEIIESAIEQLLGLSNQPVTGATERQARLREALESVNVQLQRLVAAVAAGGPLDTRLAGIKDGERRREILINEMSLAAAPGLRSVSPDQVRRESMQNLSEWRGLLRQHVSLARQLLRKVLVGRLIFMPRQEGEDSWYEFASEASLAKFLSGIPTLKAVASQSIPSWNQIASFLESMRQLRDSSGFAA